MPMRLRLKSEGQARISRQTGRFGGEGSDPDTCPKENTTLSQSHRVIDPPEWHAHCFLGDHLLRFGHP
jgi:hypothetical protein